MIGELSLRWLMLLITVLLAHNLWSAQAPEVSSSAGLDADVRVTIPARAETSSGLRRRTRSGSSRSESKSAGSELELVAPGLTPVLSDLLPTYTEIITAVIGVDEARPETLVPLRGLIAKFTTARTPVVFPAHVPYGKPGGSSFAIVAVQRRQPGALSLLAQVENFTKPDDIGRTPQSVAQELLQTAQKRGDPEITAKYQALLDLTTTLTAEHALRAARLREAAQAARSAPAHR